MKKVFMLIQRGLTDRTPVCVYPWEKPVLEEIHGSNAIEVSIDEMCDLKSPIKVKQVKLKHATEKILSLREQLEAMVRIDPENSPLNDPEGEFDRLIGCYGRHLEVNLPNVMKVYGSIGNFRRSMRDFANGKVPEFMDVSGPIVAGEKPVGDMTDDEIKAALTERGIKFRANANRETLEELFADLAVA